MHPVLFHFGAILIPAYGAVTALGMLLALFLAQQTARIVRIDGSQLWNLCVVALFTALASSRLLLVLFNLNALRQHPSWMLGLAMIHHPLPASFGALVGLMAALVFDLWQRMPLWTTADALAAPLALGAFFEQLGALAAGAGYGIESGAGIATHWAVTFTDPLTAQWSNAPLGIPLHPVEAYAALGFLFLSVLLLLWLPNRRQQGEVAGLLLMGSGLVIYFTEFWRDPEGRGTLLGGVLDGPQALSAAMVLAGGILLLKRKETHLEDEAQNG